VYFGGEVLAGQEPAAVRERLGQLFKVGDSTLDRLFNGKLHVLKRDCDKATALKYKQAMERAGARPVIKPAGDNAAAPAAAEPATTEPISAAERIAALAAAPDVDDYRSTALPQPEAESETKPADSQDEAFDLAPPESDVLRPDERAPDVKRDIDTGSLAVDIAAERLAEPAAAAPPAPDVSHLSMGEVGAKIPTLERADVPAPPDTDALSLSPEGTDFSDCAGPDQSAPELDLSGLDVAPAGSEVLESRYRKTETHSAPATDHLQLND
jgi:hypothetical protein